MRRKTGFAGWICGVVLALVAQGQLCAAPLKPFPLRGGQRGTVACLETPGVSYDIYLPASYTTNGTALPILYTFNPGGGGMVSDFQSVCSSLNIIVVGVLGVQNGMASWDVMFRETYAVSRDIRQRVLFDPAGEFSGGFSGGGEAAYVYARSRAQHIAGVFAMAGWLGRYSPADYTTTDRFHPGLLVARATGTTDTAALFYLTPDSNYLASCSATVKDWSFVGGHQVAPDATKTVCLTWLKEQRVAAGPMDQASARDQGLDWRARIAAGQSESVLRECVMCLIFLPKSWLGLEAQVMLDDLMSNFTTFRKLQVDGLAEGDFASDLFYYIARGAAAAGDVPRRQCALKALTGVTGVNGDRAGDIYAILTQRSYPAPVLWLLSGGDSSGGMVWLRKETPGLAYTLEGRTNLMSGSWQGLSGSVQETNTTWSGQVEWPGGAGAGFYRVKTTLVPATSPPWP